MDFTVNDDQQALIESARRFAKQKLAPGYRAGDKSGRVDRRRLKQWEVYTSGYTHHLK